MCVLSRILAPHELFRVVCVAGDGSSPLIRFGTLRGGLDSGWALESLLLARFFADEECKLGSILLSSVFLRSVGGVMRDVLTSSRWGMSEVKRSEVR